MHPDFFRMDQGMAPSDWSDFLQTREGRLALVEAPA